MSEKMKVLVIGDSTAFELAKQGYQEDKYDIEFVGKKFRLRKTDYYDEVLCFHVLQLQAQNDVIDYLKNINRLMKVGGRITVMVPSVDWVADQLVFEQDPSPVSFFVLFGKDGDNRSGHNLRSLRRDMALSGFAVSHANEGYYQIILQGQDGIPVEVDAGQAIVVAKKRNEVEDAPYKTVKG